MTNATDRPDARAHPRHAVKLTTEVRVDGRTRAAHTRDLSRGGVSLHSDQPIERGTAITVRVALCYGAASSSRVELGARVVWCTALPAGGYQIGARLETMSSGARRQLSGFLRQLAAEGLATSGGASQRVAPGPTSAETRFDVGDDL